METENIVLDGMNFVDAIMTYLIFQNPLLIQAESNPLIRNGYLIFGSIIFLIKLFTYTLFLMIYEKFKKAREYGIRLGYAIGIGFMLFGFSFTITTNALFILKWVI